MAGREFDGKIGTFALGVAVGLVLNSVGKQMYERVRVAKWHRDYERTDVYDENLPDSLERREPAPGPNQPRYGGTGALGVHPAAAEPR
jgi:hypothetical protein